MPQTTAPEPQIFEKGDRIYIVAPVSPFTPGQNEIAEFAFAQELQKTAPNENIMWLRGQYVEADNPNANGQMWTAGELAIKQLTPMFMPVTIMHDERTAVGLIADTALRLPETASVPRPVIDTSLALWKHRFPAVCEEAQVNYEQGTLMQSMECHSPHYSCRECGKLFHKLPGGAERENWCQHLSEAGGVGARILGNVVFTGTGLIFGTRGARGAFDKAHLDVFQDEVAEFHEKAHRDQGTRSSTGRRRKVANVETVEISKSEYDGLKADKARLDETTQKLSEAEEAKAAAERKVEEEEAAKTAAEERATEAEKKVKDFEEQAQKDELAKERLGKLGKGFLSRLGEFTRERVNEQASKLTDDEWEARLKELEETTETSRDATEGGEPPAGGGGGGGGSEEFSREEVASSAAGGMGRGGGGGGGTGTEPSKHERASVMSGLLSGNGNGKGE